MERRLRGPETVGALGRAGLARYSAALPPVYSGALLGDTEHGDDDWGPGSNLFHHLQDIGRLLRALFSYRPNRLDANHGFNS